MLSGAAGSRVLPTAAAVTATRTKNDKKKGKTPELTTFINHLVDPALPGSVPPGLEERHQLRLRGAVVRPHLREEGAGASLPFRPGHRFLVLVPFLKK